MEPTEAGAARQVAAPAGRLEELSASARGWHTIQMAVLGFIGICGVLRTTASPAPRAVQWLAAALAVAALAAASLAIFTVGRVAYPVNDAADGGSALPVTFSDFGWSTAVIRDPPFGAAAWTRRDRPRRAPIWQVWAPDPGVLVGAREVVQPDWWGMRRVRQASGRNS